MSADRQILYLDHMASTPLDPEVRDAMLPWLEMGHVGNPHSEHAAGWRAAKAIEAARAQVADLIGAQPGEIYFTSGATEANNLALFGLSDRYDQLVISAIEHPAVLEPAAELSGEGKNLTMLRPDRSGKVDLADLEGAIEKGGKSLVSIMTANNEIGAIQDIAAIGTLCRANGALFHTDAVQAISNRQIDVGRDRIDLLSLSGHKIYGPGGIGALFVRQGLEVEPRVFGGGQQKGVRPGTLPVALIVALGVACAVVARRRENDVHHMRRLRDRLRIALDDLVPGLMINTPEDGVPGCLSVTIPGIDAADLLLGLPDLAASTGSACSSLESSPSHVLRAIGLSAEQAHSTLRFGIGRHTTEEEVDTAAHLLRQSLRIPENEQMKA